MYWNFLTLVYYYFRQFTMLAALHKDMMKTFVYFSKRRSGFSVSIAVICKVMVIKVMKLSKWQSEKLMILMSDELKIVTEFRGGNNEIK